MRELEREHRETRAKADALGTAAEIAAGVATIASQRERRLFVLAGLSLTAINVGISIAALSLMDGL